MAICRFCDREFGSRQAVRAHLKACAAYQGRDLRQPPEPAALGRPSLVGTALTQDFASEGPAFDPVQQMQQRVAAERLRLKLREIEQAHGELDAREAARRKQEIEFQARQTEAVGAAEREREAAKLREESSARARREAEEAKQRLQATRRAIIQDVKHAVVDQWINRFSASSELKAQILQATEAALSPLPVQELPKAELVQIAEGVRERLYGEAQRAEQARIALQQKRQSLVQFGVDYAGRELRDVEGLEFTERWRIETRIKEELREVTGEETRAEIVAWVEEIFEEEGLELADDD